MSRSPKYQKLFTFHILRYSFHFSTKFEIGATYGMSSLHGCGHWCGGAGLRITDSLIQPFEFARKTVSISKIGIRTERRRKQKTIHKKLGISVYVTTEFHSKYPSQRRSKLHICASDRPNYLHADTHSLTQSTGSGWIDLRTWMRNTYWKRMEKQNKKRKTAIHRNTNNVRIVVTREVIPSLSRRHNRGRKRRWSNGRKMHLPSLHTRNQTNGEQQQQKMSAEKQIAKEKILVLMI